MPSSPISKTQFSMRDCAAATCDAYSRAVILAATLRAPFRFAGLLGGRGSQLVVRCNQDSAGFLTRHFGVAFRDRDAQYSFHELHAFYVLQAKPWQWLAGSSLFLLLPCQ
jgi:hypothetical protein